MEASGALRVVENTLVDHDRRLIANHDTIARIRDGDKGVNAHETKIATIATELRETREDIGEIRKDVISLKHAFWAAAGTLALVFVALTTLLITIASGGGAG